ncbi:MAG: M23 family metallopeptidase [Calditrichaeota bacterium]|nr:M23 family metallopeptidase [Calditrichota bacterium]MCB9089740.1 M23 family metallopeptidase [Calditrichia bacterium]
MNTLILFAEHFLVPGAFLIWQWRKAYRSKFDGWLMIFLVGVYIARLYFVGDWHLYGIYWRTVYAGLALLVSIKTLFDIRELPWWVKRHPRETFGIGLVSFLGLLFLAIVIWAYWGRSYSGEAFDTGFPFKQGRYYVIEGGDSPVINEYHRFPPVPEKYSLALVKLNAAGKRAAGIFPDRLEDYEIYGDRVYSPADAVVLAVRDSIADTLHPDARAQTEDYQGNYIILARDAYQIRLAGLQSGSVAVAVGDTVAAGRFLARVGMSGMVSEPQLYIQVTRPRRQVDFPWEREGVPVLLGGRFWVKNDLIALP